MSITRFNARALSVAAAMVIGLSGTSRADTLVWADGGPVPVMHTYDLANPGDTIVPITNLTANESVVGMCTPPAPWFPTLVGQLVSSETLFTQDLNAFEHRLRGYSLTTGGAFNGSVLNDGGYYMFDIVGYQQHSTDSGQPIALWGQAPKPSADYRVAIDRYGDVYKPGTKVSPAIYIDTLDLDGPVIATSKSPGGRVLVLTRSTNKTLLNSVSCMTDPGGPVPYKVKVMGRFEVTYPKGYYGANIFSIAMKQDKADKEIYALVRTYEAQWPKPLGEILLCKGKTINGKLDLAKVATVQPWHWGNAPIYQEVVPMVVR